MDKMKVKMGLLNDYYGGLLTKYQSEIIHLYHDRDLSLAEIASEYDISRQAVSEVLARSQKKLATYEQKLGLVEKIQNLNVKMENLLEQENIDQLKQELKKIILEVKDI